jgi:RecJ-like exonuclease
MSKFPCFKCNGSGQVAFKHIENGVCFQCGGAGTLSYQPKAKAEADPNPDLLVPADKRATDKQWEYLLRLVRENDDKFCRFVRAAGGKIAAQRYVTKAIMSRAIDLARAGA